MHQEQQFGAVVVLSGPSGVGKTTVCTELKNLDSKFYFSVSCTTRPRRPHEIDGQAYRFMDDKLFQQCLKQGLFLEHAVVHSFFYGTLKQELDPVKDGKDTLLDIDVQGMRQVTNSLKDMSFYAKRLVRVFLMPPNMAELERRLRGRQTDPEDAIRRRLHNAAGEMACWREYDYVLINEDSRTTANALWHIVDSVHYRSSLITMETWK